ncbi:MAG: hypothetical protein U9N59_04275 [Campylobacterota bacterium]|nr:hypothetical protein [Campylobacterota bacterium]
MKYGYYFKNSYYFRKMITKKYMIDRNSNLIYRRSLRKCVNPLFYSFLENNKEELAKLLTYINRNLTTRLKEVKMTTNDISDYVYEICETYREEAKIENSILEQKRIDSIEYIDEQGLHQGYLLQSITKRYKELDLQYKNLNDTEKTQRLGTEILKHSNISVDDVLKIPAENLITFYEMLIKSERDVLKNDIKLYIKRNLIDFMPLVALHIIEEAVKVEEAFYKYLELVENNEYQNDYLDLVKNNNIRGNIKDSTPAINEKDFMAKVMLAIEEKNKDTGLESQLNIDAIFEEYLKIKLPSEDRANQMRSAVVPFKDYLSGYGSNYPAKSINDLTEKDIIEFGKLLADARPKVKNEEINLFELVLDRRETNKKRYADNTASTMEANLTLFWKFIAKHINKNLDSTLFDNLNFVNNINDLKSDRDEFDTPLRAFTSKELQKLINIELNDNKIKKMLRDSPRNFYTFPMQLFFGMRINEIALLRISDFRVQEKDGKKYYYIWLNENGLTAYNEPKKIKNKNAHRNIPISELLIDLGLFNYIEKRRNQEKEWLFDLPKSGYGSILTYYSRVFKDIFPYAIQSIKISNPDIKNKVQSKSFRKNFSEYLFSENRTEFDTTENKKRLMGHSLSTTGTYLGRGEPYKLKMIIDAIEDYNLDFSTLKQSINEYCKGTIIRDLNIKENYTDEWKEKSRVKPMKNRKAH